MQPPGRKPEQDRWRERFAAAMSAYRTAAYDEAAVALQEAIPLALAIGDACAELATTYNTLAAVESNRGQLSEAERHYVRALEIWERCVGPDHTNVSATLTNLALLCKSQKRFDEAERNLMRALDIDRRANAPSHPHVASALVQLAAVLKARGDAHRSEVALLEALEAWPPSPLGDGTAWQSVLEDLAALYADAPPHAMPAPSRLVKPDLLAQLNRAAGVLRGRGRLVDGSRIDSRRRALQGFSNPTRPLIVGPGGHYATIAEALAQGGTRPRISLLPGTYREPVVLSDGVLIEAAGRREDVIIETDGRTALRLEQGAAIVYGVTLRVTGYGEATAVEVTGGSLSLESCEVTSPTGDGVDVRGASAELALGRTRILSCRGIGIRIRDGAKADVSECEVERNALGVQIDGPGTALVRSSSISYGGVGVAVTARARATIQACEINNQSEAGVKIHQGSNPTFTRVRVRDGSGVGLSFDGRSNGLFEDGEVSSCSGSLVTVTGGAAPRLIRCQFHSGGEDGLVVKGEGGATLVDSVVRDMARTGVSVSGGTFSLRSCRVVNNRRGGLALASRAEVELERCDVDGNGGHGLTLTGGSTARVNGCKVTANHKAALAAEDGSSATVIDSDLRSNQSGAWAVADGCHVDARGNLD